MDPKKFVVRKNCEYSLLVEAPTEDAAMQMANDTDLSEWDTAWSDSEVEEERG